MPVEGLEWKVEAFAKAERRTVPMMLRILIEEALQARGEPPIPDAGESAVNFLKAVIEGGDLDLEVINLLSENLGVKPSVLSKIYKTVRESQDEDTQKTNENTIQDLVLNWGDLESLAKLAKIPIENLNGIAEGKPPTDDDLIGLGRVLEQSTEELLEIRAKTFQRKHKRKQTNGS